MSTPADSRMAWADCGGHDSSVDVGSSWWMTLVSALPTEITIPILLPQSGHVIQVILSFLAAISIRLKYFTGWVKSGVVKLLTVECF